LKSVPCIPTSHPFIEQVIGTIRRECLDQIIFFNKLDLERKLDHFQAYYNEDRVHSSLNLKTAKVMASEKFPSRRHALLEEYRWNFRCGGLYQLPAAA
jgi:putative transposase